MKILQAILIALILFTGCAKNEQNNIIELNDRVFLGQVNDIYLNTNDYLGKTIKLEGILFKSQDEFDNNYHFVMRFGPGGCCGFDGLIGFEVKWTGGNSNSYPEDQAWVEAIGELKQYSDGSFLLLYLDLISLTELQTRGKEYIN